MDTRLKLPLQPGQLGFVSYLPVPFKLQGDAAVVAGCGRSIVFPAKIGVTVHIEGFQAALCGDFHVLKAYKSILSLHH